MNFKESGTFIEGAQLTNYDGDISMNGAYNSLFRKIFGYRNFESVTDLQLSLARPTWKLLCHSQKDSFYHHLQM